jgi:Xaa-Pro aminopeptidase
LLTDLEDIRYLSGFTGSAGWALLTLQNSFLLLDFRYLTQAAEEVSGFEVVPTSSSPWKVIADLSKKLKVKRLGFVSSELAYDHFSKLKDCLDGVELVPVHSIVGRLRMIKEPEEIEAIQESARLLSETMNEVLGLLRPGMKEREVAALFEYGLKLNGADRAGFETIVASGPRSAMPHAVPSERTIKAGEFVKIDGGCQWKGYHSDLTRTVVWGKASPEQERIYQVVLRAHDEALAAARPQIKAEELDAVCRRIIEEAGFGDFFGHGTGHGVGLSVHEEPRIGRDSKVILEEGMTFTIEPGIYIPGTGGVRIEDTILLSGSGAQVLTKSLREMLL